jgi:hypothetical protein
LFDARQAFVSYDSKENIWLILGSDTEETTQVPLRNIRSVSNMSQSILETPPSDLNDGNNNEEYEKQAEEILDEIWKIYNDDNSWYEEAKSKDGTDIVLSKTFPKWGKIFRLTVRK